MLLKSSVPVHARLALADVLIDVRAAYQARNDDLLFWGLHCYVAQLLLGDSISEVQIRLDAASTFLDATIHSFASAGERLPNLRASQLVLLSGGAPAYWHINGILSTMSAGRLSKLVDLELARRAVPIKSGAACFYKLEGSTKLSFCLPNVFSICKSPRPECGHGMKEGYIQAEHVLGGDFTAGCKLSVLLRDRWEAQLQSTSIALEVESAACVFGLGRNNYNPDVISELGVDAAGTHYYHSWFRDLKITLGEPSTSVVVPFDLLDFSVANAPDGKDVAKHFRMTVAAALDHFAPSSIFMRWAVPREAVFKSFTSGTDWSVGAVFFMGSIQADIVQQRAVVGAVYNASPMLAVAMCVTERGRYLQSGKWTTGNVGCVFAIALARCFAGSIIIDIVQARPEPGGLRDSQLRAMRAPPRTDGGCWKAAVSDEVRRASDFLIRQHHSVASTRHTPVPLDLMLSLSGTGTAYPQWREAVAYAAQRYSASGVILTLIPDFWHIDPNHHDYPGMRETRKHRATI